MGITAKAVPAAGFVRSARQAGIGLSVVLAVDHAAIGNAANSRRKWKARRQCGDAPAGSPPFWHRPATKPWVKICAVAFERKEDVF
jgi:hypothetical protein